MEQHNENGTTNFLLKKCIFIQKSLIEKYNENKTKKFHSKSVAKTDPNIRMWTTFKKSTDIESSFPVEIVEVLLLRFPSIFPVQIFLIFRKKNCYFLFFSKIAPVPD